MLKRIITAGFLSAVFALAQETKNSADPRSVVPKGATEISPGLYRHVDAEGKAWLYRHTPFGFSKTEDKPEARSRASAEERQPSSVPASAAGTRQTPFGEVPATATASREHPARDLSGITTAVEDGENIRFERPSPFGTYRWSRKKTELTDDEKKAWESKRGSVPARENTSK